jgi:dienelactone hydrolase
LWLAGLASRADEEAGGHGLGVVGMCLTGAMPLELFPLANVKAAVISQPSLPIALGPFGKGHTDATGVADPTLQRVRDSGLPLLAFRFREDKISPAARMGRFERTFGDQLTLFEPSSKNTPPGEDNKHSVLTGPWTSADMTTARAMLSDYLHAQLDDLNGDSARTAGPDSPSLSPDRE